MDVNEFVRAGIALVIIIAVLIFILVGNKKKKEQLIIATDPEPEKEEKKASLTVLKEYEFTVSGTYDNAERTSRNRQMLLMEMSNYDGVILQINRDKPKDIIMVLSEQGYDLGYLQKEDQELVYPYMERDNFKIESGVHRFYRDQQGENLSIYVTVLEYTR